MTRRLAGSGLRNVAPLYWAVGALGALPGASLGRLYSAALAYDAALAVDPDNRGRGAGRAGPDPS